MISGLVISARVFQFANWKTNWKAMPLGWLKAGRIRSGWGDIEVELYGRQRSCRFLVCKEGMVDWCVVGNVADAGSVQKKYMKKGAYCGAPFFCLGVTF